MTTVFIAIGVSIDGFVAGANRGPANPLGDGFAPVHDWMFDRGGFRRDGPEGVLLERLFDRTGAYVMGRNMFDEGEAHWSDATFRGRPVYVLTHRAREPWLRSDNTVYHFVTDGFDSAMAQALAAAEGKDIRVMGGADVARQALHAGVVDELTLHVAPALVGAGLRLFDGFGPGDLDFRQTGLVDANGVSHITYKPR